MTERTMPSPLLPDGITLPRSRSEHPSIRLRRLLKEKPYVFAPGVYDPHGAQIAMYHGVDAIYFSGYSFAMGHLGATDMDLYSSVEIADGARRTVSALRKLQLTAAVGDLEHGVPGKTLEIPPVLVDMDTGYGNVFNVQRTTELYVNAGVAAAHIEDQVAPKRCGHIAGKALIPAGEMVGKLRMMRAVADDLGNKDFVIVARTDGVSAVDALEDERGLDLALERAYRYLDSGIPDLVWCEFPTAERGPVEKFADEVLKRYPDAQLAFNFSSSFKWFNESNPLTFAELGQLGHKFIFITLAAQHSMAYGFSRLLRSMAARNERPYIEMQHAEWADDDLPTKSHHVFSGVPYHQLLGELYGSARLGREVTEGLAATSVV
ncbi:MAG: isocitrate lyase/PEP mutase family protein [Chloroflexi bacterium]|nr:isocitrate lyase/PEP mutase family protein [Chloroflexota bacterium]